MATLASSMIIELEPQWKPWISSTIQPTIAGAHMETHRSCRASQCQGYLKTFLGKATVSRACRILSMMIVWNWCNLQIQIITQVTQSSPYLIANITRACLTSVILQNTNKRPPKVQCQLDRSRLRQEPFKIVGQLTTLTKWRRKNWGRATA